MATVRKRPTVASKTQPQNIYNAFSEWATQQAKSGNAARMGAKQIKAENDGAKLRGKTPKVVKVDSNPVKAGVTRIGRMSGGGAGGMFGIKNR
jgi:hypothetical protein